MRWLLAGDLTPAVAEALRRHGDQAVSAIASGIDPADPDAVLQAVRDKQLDLLTADARLVLAATSAAQPLNRSVVYLQLDGGDVEQDDAVDRLFARYKRLTPNRLYTVTASRVKIRQLAGS